jgi:hypothetical protein
MTWFTCWPRGVATGWNPITCRNSSANWCNSWKTFVKKTLNVSVSVTVTVPPTVVDVNAVPVLVVAAEVAVLVVVTPVSTVVSPTEEVSRVVVVLVDRIDV